MVAMTNMPMGYRIEVVQAASAQRGYLAEVCVGERTILCVGGQTREVTMMVSSNGRDFVGRKAGESGLRDAVSCDGTFWVVGEYGYLARSDDDGASWTAIETGTKGCLFSAARIPGLVEAFLIAGDHGYVARVNRDATVQPLATELNVRIFAVVPKAETTWLLADPG